MPRSSGVAWIIAAGLVAAASPAAAAKVGVAAAVAPSAWGASSGGAPRSLAAGADLEAGERVRTDSSGSLQILFDDRSSVALGPDAELTLDEYVYRPERREGSIGVSLGKGLLRFVGGAISKDNPVSIRTPTATIGIRGGIAIVEARSTTSATFLFGAGMTVTAGGETVSISRPGFRIAIGADGRPTAPEAISEGILGDLLRALEPRPNPQAPADAQHASVRDDDVAQTQLAALNEIGLLGEIETAAGGDEPGSLPPPDGGEAVEIAEASRQDPERVAAAPGEEPAAADAEPPAPSRPSGPLVGRAKVAAGPDLGAADGDPTRNRPLSGASFAGGRFEAEASDGLLFTLVQGAGAEFASTAQPFGAATLVGPAIAFDPDFVVFELAAADGGRAFAFAGAPTPPSSLPSAGVSSYQLGADFLRGQNLPFVPDVSDPASGAAAGPGRAYVAWDAGAAGAQRAFAGGAVAIFGAGAEQQRAVSFLFGDVVDDGQGRPHVRARMFGMRRAGTAGAGVVYRGGVSSADAAGGADFLGESGNFVLEASLVDADDTAIARGLSQSGGEAVFPNHVAAAPAALTGARTTRALVGFAGGLERTFADGAPSSVQTLTSAGQFGVAIATRAELNTVMGAFKLRTADAADPLQIQFGDVAPAGLSAFIDDRTFVAASSTALTGDQFALITASELQHSGFLPAGSAFCACEFVTWGFWSGERGGTAGPAQRRQIELAAWVAGQPFDAALTGIPVQTATYNGHLVGEVAKGGTLYQAAGGLKLSLRFAPGGYRLDGASIVSFDGMNFTADMPSITPTFTANAYSTQGVTLKSDNGAVTAQLRGAFFGAAPAGQPPLETAGDFDMAGAGYQAAGVYAARR